MKGFVRGLLVLALLVGTGAGLGGRLSDLLPFDVLTSPDACSFVFERGCRCRRRSKRPTRTPAPPSNRSSSAATTNRCRPSRRKIPALMADTLTSDHYQELRADQPGLDRQRRRQHQAGQARVGRSRHRRLERHRHDLRDVDDDLRRRHDRSVARPQRLHPGARQRRLEDQSRRASRPGAGWRRAG